MGARDEIAKLTAPARIHAAKAKTKRVVDRLLYLVELHENNALLVYSDRLSSQILTADAASAFEVFQRGMYQIELVCLCALWDGLDLKKDNVPTIVELVNPADVIETLAAEYAAQWKDKEDQEFAEQQGQKARASLRKAIDDAREIGGSTRLQRIMNLRHKQLAHSLSESRQEQRSGPIAPMKYGDERVILEATLPIVAELYCWINRRSFSFPNSRENAQRNAKALWEGCKFTIE